MFINVRDSRMECVRTSEGVPWVSQVATHAVFCFTGAGVREDVFLIWRELEEACSTLAQIQRLVAEPPKSCVTIPEYGWCHL